MAKREFIDTDKITYVSLEDSLHFVEYYKDSEAELNIVAPRISEEEIVKPYLEKLKEQIRYDYNRNIWGQYEYEKVMDSINNLLSETEVKE